MAKLEPTAQDLSLQYFSWKPVPGGFHAWSQTTSTEYSCKPGELTDDGFEQLVIY